LLPQCFGRLLSDVAVKGSLNFRLNTSTQLQNQLQIKPKTRHICQTVSNVYLFGYFNFWDFFIVADIFIRY
jgi:hypothetical protein